MAQMPSEFLDLLVSHGIGDRDVRTHSATRNSGKRAHHKPGCSRGLNPPVSSRDLAM